MGNGVTLTSGLGMAVLWWGIAACSGDPEAHDGNGQGGADGVDGAGGSDKSGVGGSGGTDADGSGGSGADAIPLAWTELDPVTTGGELAGGNHLGGFEWLFRTEDNVLFAATFAFLYRSEDGGDTWDPVQNGGEPLPGAEKTSLTGVENLVKFKVHADVDGTLIGSSHRGLYASDDEGITWRVLLLFDGADRIEAVHAVSSSEIYIAVSNGFLYFGQDIRSTSDGGENWTSWGATVASDSLTVDKYGTLFTGGPYLRRTRDSQSWFEVNDENAPTSLTGLDTFADGSIVARSSEGFVRSTDYGDTWTTTEGIGFHSLEGFSQILNGTHAAFSFDTFYHSADFGDSWQTMESPSADDWTGLVQLDDGTMLATWTSDSSSGELWKSAAFEAPDPASQNSPADRPMTCYDGVLSGDETRVDCGGICGLCEDWFLRACGQSGLFGSNAGTLFSYDSSNDLLRSTDAGLTWERAGSLGLLPMADIAGSIIAAGTTGFVVSTDEGETFAEPPGATFPEGSLIEIVGTSEGDLFGVYEDSLARTYVSSDDGVTWEEYDNLDPHLAQMPDGSLLGYGDHTNISGYLFLPTDTGFESTAGNLPAAMSALWAFDSHVYALVVDEVYRTANDLSAFELWSTVPPSTKTAPFGPRLKQADSGWVFFREATAYFSDDGSAWVDRSNGLRNRDGLTGVSANEIGYASLDDRMAAHHFGCTYVSRPLSDW